MPASSENTTVHESTASMMAPITKGLKAADVYVIVKAIAVSRAEPAAF